MNFDTLDLHPSIMNGITKLGFTEMTPIQERAIKPALAGRDIIGLAQTGTGKTAAFVLPVLQKLLEHPQKKIGAVVLTPTRELAEQVNDVFNSLGRTTGLKSTAVYGGTNMDQQFSQMSHSSEIIVACPGRLLDHLWRGSIDLSGIDILVIDEADRMLDMGFLPDVRKIISCILHEHQTLLFSATMPPNIRKLVNEILHDPMTVKIGMIAPAKTVKHSLYPVKQNQKTDLLMSLLRSIESQSVLVFTKTKHRTEEIAQRLRRSGFKVASLQGDLTQERRQAAIDAFRKGRIKILIATDIASRGIDILNISHVINYDMPQNIEDYIHRIGRTGRVNTEGEAMTLVTGADAGMIKSIEKVLNKPIERRKIEGFKYSDAAEKKQPEKRKPRFRSRKATQKKVTVGQPT